MRKFVMCLLVVSMLATFAGEASAHDWRTSEGWSPWKVVTWNPKYSLVHHKHVSNGTVCEALRRDGSIERFKLVTLNATNRTCIGDGSQG